MNQKRLNRTATRLVMPEVPKALFFDALRELLDVDREWLPEADQGALYIRPSYLGIDRVSNGGSRQSARNRTDRGAG